MYSFFCNVGLPTTSKYPKHKQRGKDQKKSEKDSEPKSNDAFFLVHNYQI